LGEEVLNWNNDFKLALENEIHPLASDSISREDILAWRKDDFDQA